MNPKIQSCFPAYLNLKDASCLVVGGGRIAFHKVNILREYCPDIRVVAEDFSEEFNVFEPDEAVRMIRKPFSPEDLHGMTLVVSAAGDRNLDLEIFTECQKRNIPVNTVDCPELCTFIFPAILHDGLLNIAISTNGASPSAARYLKRLIQTDLPDNISSILEFLLSCRPEVIRHVEPEKKRSLFFKSLFDECLHLQRPLTEKEFHDRLDALLSPESEEENERKETEAPEVVLAGAGCSDAAGLTREVRDLILRAPVVFYDDLIDQSIIDLIANKGVRIGKRKGRHSYTQDEINRLLIEAARKNPWVLRLKGGDPFVFGRGMEEVEALENAGIRTRVLGGLTSCIAVPQRMNIPVTDRRMAGSFLVISASSKDPNRLFSEDPRLLAKYSGTLVILMGFTKIKEIAKTLIEAGKSPDTPAAAISSPSISKSVAVSSDLADLAEDVKKADLKAPGILVIGDVVRYMNDRHQDENHPLPKENACRPLLLGVCSTERFFRKLSKDLPSPLDPLLLLNSDITPLPVDLSKLFGPQNAGQNTKQTNKEDEKERWLVFLSETGSELFLKTLKDQRIDLRSLYGVKIACIGEATARPFEKAGIIVDLIPKRADSIHLAEELSTLAQRSAELFTFRSAEADDQLEVNLKADRFNVTRLDLYSLAFTSAITPERLVKRDFQGFCFGSRLAVRAFAGLLESLGEEEKKKILSQPAFCLSKQTGSLVRKTGFTKVYEPEEISALSLAEKISEIAGPEL